MQAPLAGLRVVVTRPAAQADPLVQRIESLGGRVERLPLIEIEAVQDAAGFARIAAALERYQWIFFVSANAIEQGLAGLRAHRSLPPTLPVATVGPASAAALRAQGFDAVCVPPTRFDSEGVLALEAFSQAQVAGREILILRGDGGRELLAQALCERGAKVEVFSCYHRRLPALDLSPWRAAAPSVWVLSSSEALAHLARSVQAQGLQSLLQMPLLVPHPRIAAAAHAAGFCQVIETEPGDEGICAGLARFHRRSQQGLGYHS